MVSSVRSVSEMFLQSHVEPLEHVVEASGIFHEPKKIHSEQRFSIPITASHVRRILGIVGYYGRFINGFVGVSAPHALTSNKLVSSEILSSKFICIFKTEFHNTANFGIPIF